MESKPNSQVLSLLRGYISHVFQDVAYIYARSSDWKRDHSRLLHELGIKGQRLLTLDFPAIAKHFDKCLDQGLYQPCHMPLTRCVSKSVQVPAFMRGLYLKVFDNDGKLRHSPDLNAIVAIRTLLMGAKKLRLKSEDWRLHDELDEFLTCERAIRPPDLNWLGDDLFDPHPGLYPGQVSSGSVRQFSGDGDYRIGVRRLHLADALPCDNGQLELGLEPIGSDTDGIRDLAATIQLCADIVVSSFGDLHIEDPSELPRHGPGVVSDVKRGESKFDFPYWTPKTEAIFPFDRYGSHCYGSPSYSKDAEIEWVSHEAPSKIVAVPKTAKGPRLIAAEPVHHQWLQQLVMNQLVRRLDKTPIADSVRFNDQNRNREFARKGSVDGSFATIDLSSASDRVSCWMVERFFRANWSMLERFHASRTRSAEWRGSKGYPSFRILLKKFAPMGSAETFPVQSIIYCIVAIACDLHRSKTRVTSKAIKEASVRCSVFGDDIIVPQQNCATVIRALEYLGLKVNTSKTFSTGKFRESCGLDAWGGYDVTPPYVLDLPDTVRFANVGSLTAVSNNYFCKGFWKTSNWLSARLNKFSKLIPTSANGEQGNSFFSYSGADLNRLKRRFNAALQREEVYCLRTSSPKDKGPSSPSSRLFQWFIESPPPDSKWVSGVVERKRSTTNAGWLPVDKMLERSNANKIDQGTFRETRY